MKHLTYIAALLFALPAFSQPVNRIKLRQLQSAPDTSLQYFVSSQGDTAEWVLVSTIGGGSGSTDTLYFAGDSGTPFFLADGDTLTIAGAGIASTSASGSTITVTATEVDGSTTNELGTISSITYVPDTTSLTPKAGDMFINSTADTLGGYDLVLGWQLFVGGYEKWLGTELPAGNVTIHADNNNLYIDTIGQFFVSNIAGGHIQLESNYTDLRADEAGGYGNLYLDAFQATLQSYEDASNNHKIDLGLRDGTSGILLNGTSSGAAYSYRLPTLNPSTTLNDTTVMAWRGTGSGASPVGFVPYGGGGGNPGVSTVTLSNTTLDTVDFNSQDHGIFHVDAGSTSRDTLYFLNAVDGGQYTIDLDNITTDTIYWPDNLMDANEDTVSARIYTAGKMVSFYYDGTNYFTPQALGSALIDTIPAADTLLLDNYGDSWAAISLRKIAGSYAGNAIQVTRASDDATQGIGFISTFDLDTTTLNTFCAGTDCYVTIWYDQSGNSRNFSQADTSKAPLIVQGGTIIRENGLPAVESDGVNDYMQSSATNTSQSGWVFAVNVSNNSTLLSQSSTLNNDNYTGLGSSSNVSLNQSIRYLGSVGVGTGAIFYGDTSVHLVQRLITYTSSGSAWSGWINGTIQTMNSFSGTNTGYWFGDNTQNPMVLSGLVRSSTAVNANIMQEIVIYNIDQTGNRASIETDINGYYSIY